MKKRIQPLILGVAILMIAVALSGCSGSKLSGTYVNPDDSSNYVVFDRSTATFYEGGVEGRSGTFRESAKTSSGDYLLTITFNDTSSEERFWLDENKETIYEAIFGDDAGTAGTVGDVAYIKE
jgi:hypothetical protein